MPPRNALDFPLIRRRGSGAGLLATALLTACAVPLPLPPDPALAGVPTIDSIEPSAGFADDVIVVTGTGFEADPGSNELLFLNGRTSRAHAGEAGRLSFHVPYGLDGHAPVTLATTRARSAPTPFDFIALGSGHPTIGAPVADLRFRHKPVGVVDRAEIVLVGSTLFDLVLTDTGTFTRVPGRPQALSRLGDGARALLSLRTAAGGRVLELDSETGAIHLESEESTVLETILLEPPPATPTAVARTIGVDARGSWWVSEWRRRNGGLVPERRPLAMAEVTGAAVLGDAVYVVGTAAAGDADPALFKVDREELTDVWRADGPSELPSGPVAVVEAAGRFTAVLGLQNGDLAFVALDDGSWRHVVMISFAPVGAIAPSVAPGRVVLTKPLDGAVFQYDVATEDIEWTVQVRGEPTVLDVAADIDEVAVANSEDNAVDIISGTSGQWLGRISFSLGLGSADGGEGGMVAPYSYHPDSPKQETVMELLARNLGLVLRIDASTLEVLSTAPLAPEASPAQRLVLTPDLQTLVVHRRDLGLLEPAGERLVARDLPATPTSVGVLADGRVVVGTLTAVELYEWRDELLVRVSGLPVPPGATLAALHANAADVLVAWKSGAGYGGGLFAPEELRPDGAPTLPLTLDPGLGELLGAVGLADGPALLFGRSSRPGPALLTAAALRGEAPPVPSVLGRAQITGVSPDRRYVVWLDESAAEHTVRLLYTDAEGLYAFSTYRLAGRGAGPAFDPSGQWLYVPIPKLDMLTVVQ